MCHTSLWAESGDSMIGSGAPTGREVLKKDVMIAKQGLIEAKSVRFT